VVRKRKYLQSSRAEHFGFGWHLARDPVGEVQAGGGYLTSENAGAGGGANSGTGRKYLWVNRMPSRASWSMDGVSLQSC